MNDNLKESVDKAAGAGTSDKIEGSSRETVGRGKEAIGAATGNDSLRAEGVKDQATGKAQNAWGEVKEGADKLLDKAKEGLRKHGD